MDKAERIAVLAGGECPGINAVIRAVGTSFGDDSPPLRKRFRGIGIRFPLTRNRQWYNILDKFRV